MSKWQMIEDDPSPSESAAKSSSPDYQDLPVMGQQGSSLLIGGGGGVGGEELLTNLNGRLKNVQNSNVLISLKAIHGLIW